MRLIVTQNLSPRTEPRSKANDFPSSPSPSPSGTLWTRSARLFIQDGGVSARGSRQNTPALHAKTRGVTRVQQFAC